MKAYKNDPKLKKDLIKLAKEHRDKDLIIQRAYEYDYKGLAGYLDIPVQLVRLQDKIHEGLPEEIMKDWTVNYLEAIPVGADLQPVIGQFLHWLLVDLDHGVIRLVGEGTQEYEAIQQVANLWAKVNEGGEVSNGEWRDAYHDAAIAAEAAHTAAAHIAARTARHAAVAYHYAAVRAAVGTAAAYHAAYEAQSIKLLELIRECK